MRLTTDSHRKLSGQLHTCCRNLPTLLVAICFINNVERVTANPAEGTGGSGSTSTSFGGPGSIAALDRGWYDDTGFHGTGNLNYVAGQGSAPDEIWRDFFVFDLSSISNTVTAARLRIENPIDGFFSSDPSETYRLFDVTTPLPSLLNGTGGLAAFSDLGTGTSYGGALVSAADNGQVVEIDLNPAALADINAASGQWALGGAITTLNAIVDDEYIFGFTDSIHQVELVLRTIPEPATSLLAGLSLIFSCTLRRGIRPSTNVVRSRGL